MGRSLYTIGLVGVIATTLWALGYVLFTALIFSLNTDTLPAKADAAVVLTGGGQRIESGLALLEKGIVPKILISGVHPRATLPQLLEQQKLTLAQEFHPAIVLGRQATDTVGNATEASDWIKNEHIQTVILVTATYHMPRAMYEFKMTAPQVHLTPYAVVPNDYTPQHRKFWWLALTEYNKLILRWTRHTLMADIKSSKDAL
ncbi:MAG: YdcF family protein [Pseudomonadota bacterium]